jgi:hypothetical protein
MLVIGGVVTMLPLATGKAAMSTQQQTTNGNEVIDAGELAKRWRLPESWIREQTRTRAVDPLPCIRFGRYVRFEWGSPKLSAWYDRRRS